MSVTTTPRPAGSDSPLRARGREILDTTFSIDTRALAVVRILVGALLIARAFVEWSRPRDPDGVFEFVAAYGDILVIPFALVMLVGYRTRIATVLVWLTYSLRIRSDLLDPDTAVVVGDMMLSLALFWLMFLPLGRHLSIDARRESQPSARILSVASGAFLMQMAVIYFSAGLLKSMDEWVFEATAMEDIVASAEFGAPLGRSLLAFPSLLAALSIATVVLEVLGPILVMLPGASLPMRRLVIVPMFIALHIGIAATMSLGLFPYIVIPLWLLFLPPRFWDRVWARFGGSEEKTGLVIDRSRLRNSIAAAAVVFVTISNLITMAYYPDLEGWNARYQDVALNVVLYQQWAMFSVPSSIP